MELISSKFILIFPIFFILLVNCFSTLIPNSYLDSKNFAINDIDDAIYAEIESIYTEPFLLDSNRNDPVCSLPDSKKRTLCKLVFNFKHYQKNLKIYLNKVALHLQKLSCEDMDLVLEFTVLPNNKNKVKQRMYHCPGRHDIVRTSFIEDDFYNSLYLSAGPTDNSVIVYTYFDDATDNLFAVYDYVYNIDLFQLEDTIFKIRDLIYELNLNKIAFVSSDYQEVATTYETEQKETKLDVVCDLDYERKITLCNLVFQLRKNKPFIVLNRAAVHIFNMDCIRGRVHKINKEPEIILNEEQRLYPCYGRNHSLITNNFFEDEYFNMIHVSSGPRRNSIFIYQLIDNYDTFILSEMIENINFQLIEPTIISLSEIVYYESTLTYTEVLKIIDSMMIQFDEELSLIMMSNDSSKEESKLMEQLASFDFIKYYYDKGKHNNKNVENNDSKNVTKSNITKTLSFGSQFYKLLIEKKKFNLETIEKLESSKKVKKILNEGNVKKNTDKLTRENKQLNAKVKTLIEKMDVIAIAKIFGEKNLKKKQTSISSKIKTKKFNDKK